MQLQFNQLLTLIGIKEHFVAIYQWLLPRLGRVLAFFITLLLIYQVVAVPAAVCFGGVTSVSSTNLKLGIYVAILIFAIENIFIFIPATLSATVLISIRKQRNWQ